jgi:hypothetical protein
MQSQTDPQRSGTVTTMAEKQLSDLIPIDSPAAILEETHVILSMISKDYDTRLVDRVFRIVIDLFAGNYPGYRACNTEYHDLRHTTDVFLATARMIHGAVLDKETFSHREIDICLVSALLHDSGYIQEEHDTEGTGAKHTSHHVQRSMMFMQHSSKIFEFSDEETDFGLLMILCTDLTESIEDLSFPSPSIERLSKILAASDLLAQMADRTYLEKLLFLFHEFREAGVGGFLNEMELLNKTVEFYNFFKWRLENSLDNADRFLLSHFRNRWDINENLYLTSIDNQKKYLEQTLKIPDCNPHDHFKRFGLIDELRKRFGE